MVRLLCMATSHRLWSQAIHTYSEPGLSQGVFHEKQEVRDWTMEETKTLFDSCVCAQEVLGSGANVVKKALVRLLQDAQWPNTCVGLECLMQANEGTFDSRDET